jgi:hypothetical protein
MAESKNEPSKFQQTIDKELSEIYDNLQKKTGFSDEKMKKFADRVYLGILPAGILRLIELQKEGKCSEKEALVAIEKIARDAATNVVNKPEVETKPSFWQQVLDSLSW